jgi:hypothetical protein
MNVLNKMFGRDVEVENMGYYMIYSRLQIT